MKTALDALARGQHYDPFSLLGPQKTAGGGRVVRCFQPGAHAVELLDRKNQPIATMQQLHAEGIFEAPLPPRISRYRLRVSNAAGNQRIIEDPYRFPARLGALDLHLMGEGLHDEIYTRLGARPDQVAGVQGTWFAVWAPNALRASVVGDFNQWDGRVHVMRLHAGNGVWELFIPAVDAGARYKFELLDRTGRLLPLKSDPLGLRHEAPPGNASVVCASDYQWGDEGWMAKRSSRPDLEQAVSIYEVHLGSWRRGPDNRYLSYLELAEQLVAYVLDMGFTHVELMPVAEHPFDGSWGYQSVGLFAPTHRFGKPDELRVLVDQLHQAGIAVILDWVPAHFPRDDHGLARFDGTALYEHEDPRKGSHADWGTLIYNFGRREVVNFLVGSALYWIREFHMDALRVDAVASMLYLDYSRKAGEWEPNDQGGNENFEAVAFLKRLNQVVHRERAASHAEESTSWSGVSRPVEAGGLGFSYKWNMGWMNDTLAYMAEDPLHRKHHHEKMTFGWMYALSENFVLPLSHDEVVHGKRSLLGRMPGNEQQRFANLRAYYGFMFAHPGKKLLFMGAELAQYSEWNHDRALDWHLLEHAPHQGVQALVRDLNHIYRQTPALYQQDYSEAGFEWIDSENRDCSVFSWIRRDQGGGWLVVVSHMTPLSREQFRLGVPVAGDYQILLNTDDQKYGGQAASEHTLLSTEAHAANGHAQSLCFTLPPLATLLITPLKGG